jgi:hypothetical protein
MRIDEIKNAQKNVAEEKDSGKSAEMRYNESSRTNIMNYNSIN